MDIVFFLLRTTVIRSSLAYIYDWRDPIMLCFAVTGIKSTQSMQVRKQNVDETRHCVLILSL